MCLCNVIHSTLNLVSEVAQSSIAFKCSLRCPLFALNRRQQYAAHAVTLSGYEVTRCYNSSLAMLPNENTF